MVCDEFSHSREVTPALDHTDGSVYPTVTCDDGVVVGRDDFLDAVLRYHDFVVRPQSAVLKVLTFVALEFTGAGVEKVSENFGVLSVVVHPIVENGVGWGNKATDNVGDREDGSKEFF